MIADHFLRIDSLHNQTSTSNFSKSFRLISASRSQSKMSIVRSPIYLRLRLISSTTSSNSCLKLRHKQKPPCRLDSRQKKVLCCPICVVNHPTRAQSCHAKLAWERQITVEDSHQSAISLLHQMRRTTNASEVTDKALLEMQTPSEDPMSSSNRSLVQLER